MPDDQSESEDLDLDGNEQDDRSTYDLPDRESHLPPDDDLDAASAPRAPTGDDNAGVDGAGAENERTDEDDAKETEARRDVAAGSEVGTGEHESSGRPLDGPTPQMTNAVSSPALPVFTLTLTVRMKNGLGLCCAPVVQALVGQRNPPGGVLPSVPPLARVLTLAAREGAENADFSMLGAQVSDLLLSYALARDAAAQAEAQKKKSQAAAVRQRKRDEESRRLLTAATTGTATTGSQEAGAVTGDGASAPAGSTASTRPVVQQTGQRPAAVAMPPDQPTADTTQLSLFG